MDEPIYIHCIYDVIKLAFTSVDRENIVMYEFIMESR